MGKALSFIIILAVVLGGIYAFTKKPPVVLDENGFPKGSSEGDKFTKDGIGYQYQGGLWVPIGRPSGDTVPNDERAKSCDDLLNGCAVEYGQTGNLNGTVCAAWKSRCLASSKLMCVNWTLFNPISKTKSSISFKLLKVIPTPKCITWEKDQYLLISTTPSGATMKICEYAKI